MELKVVNRMPFVIETAPAVIRLVFRPGVLIKLEGVALAAQSELGWALSIHLESTGESRGEVVLELSGVERFSLLPGKSFAIRIDGLSASEGGGSRASRVQVDYGGFILENGDEVDGARTLHLPVLRRHEPVGIPATKLRTGSTARAGPFQAGFVGGSHIFNDGKTPGKLTVKIVNQSKHAIPLSDDGDQATRWFLSFATGDESASWGLLGSINDHLDVEVKQGGWQIDNHTLRRTSPGVWERGQSLELELTVYTQAEAGLAQLVLTFENLPGHDDGDLVLLVNLGKLATTENTVEVGAELNVSGSISSEANYLTLASKTFRVGGSFDQYYPVVFKDHNWSGGELELEVFRARTHLDERWRGSLMAKIRCHSDNYGHGSAYWSVRLRQSSIGGRRPRFVGGFENYPYNPLHILWLAGDCTYYWRSNHKASIHNIDTLDDPQAFEVGKGRTSRTYDVRNQIEESFDAGDVSLEKSLGEESLPVPSGVIMLWAKARNQIPNGWALCDGDNGTPLLQSVGQNSGNASAPRLFYIVKL